MEKKEMETIKKNLDENPEEESSSSSTCLGEGQGQEQLSGSGVKEVSLNNFPAEMLTKILENVDPQSLFACRLLSKTWREISSRILTTRSDTIIYFNFNQYDQNVSTLNKRGKKWNSIKDFVRATKNSENCPYARFSVLADCVSFSDHEDWIELLTNFAPPNPNPNQRTKIKYLALKFITQDFESLTKELRDVLVNKIPDLEELALDIYLGGGCDWNPSLMLFPPSQNTEPETNPVPVELAHLKVVIIRYFMFLYSPGILSDILGAAVNLRKIRVLNPSFRSEDKYFINHMQNALCGIFQFLHSRGKLHLLENTGIQLDHKFLSETKISNDFSRAFKLSYFKVDVAVSENPNPNLIDPNFIADATNFLSNVLESSKNTLRKLELGPLGFLIDLHPPTFKNLTALTLCQPHDSRFPFFLPETRSREIFSAVRDLDFQVVHCSSAFPQPDSVPQLPNIKTLCCLINKDIRFTESCIITLALLCPNLACFQIKKEIPPESELECSGTSNIVVYHVQEVQEGEAEEEEIEEEVEEEEIVEEEFEEIEEEVEEEIVEEEEEVENQAEVDAIESERNEFKFSQVGRWIWTHMKQLPLESLEVDVDADGEGFPALDSCFTGISMENCQRLDDLKAAGKLVQMSGSGPGTGSGDWVLPESGPEFDSELQALTKREHSSILDMKDLKQLRINPYSGIRWHQGKEFFINQISWITEEYGFKLMPQLQFNGRKPTTN